MALDGMKDDPDAESNILDEKDNNFLVDDDEDDGSFVAADPGS